jgi:DNA gyrase subunit A
MRIVIELKRDAIPRVVLNQLYKHTQMQSTFGVIMLALVPDAHTRRWCRRSCRSRSARALHRAPPRGHRPPHAVRARQGARARAHPRGLKIAVDNIDEVIKIIAPPRTRRRRARSCRSASSCQRAAGRGDPQHAPRQAHRLEIEKLEEELKEVRASSRSCKDILAVQAARMKIIKDELRRVAEKFGDERRTEITSDEGEFTIEDLIAEEDMVITISHSGYIKRTSVSTYKRQRRGGAGSTGRGSRTRISSSTSSSRSTHDYILFFTDDGAASGSRCTRSRRRPRGEGQADRQPDQRQARHADQGDRAGARVLATTQFLLFATKQGTVKKTALSQYGERPRSTASRRSRSRRATS